MKISGGQPARIPSFKRTDVDRIYSEYIQVTLKAAEEEAAKVSKIDQPTVNPEKLKRKYKKRQKENQNAQGSGVSLLKPLNQLPSGIVYTLSINSVFHIKVISTSYPYRFESHIKFHYL